MPTTSDVPDPRRVLPSSTTQPTPLYMFSLETSEKEQQMLRKLLLDLFYASPRRTPEQSLQKVREGTH